MRWWNKLVIVLILALTMQVRAATTPPAATAPATAPSTRSAPDVSGLWLTDLGLMELTQSASHVNGRYALRGTSRLDGTLADGLLDFRFASFRKGQGVFQFAEDGKTFAGSAHADGFTGSDRWRGRRATEFVPHVKLVAGQMRDGSTDGLLTYCVRAPDDYREGANTKWPTLVILHGSNMNGRAYVNTIASAWPAIAKAYLLIGINGETPSDFGDEPRFNYTYVDFVGRSTFKGFPGTDRQSPTLVIEAMRELRKVYPVARYYVGGHSQGGFLTYSVLMNYPEEIAGGLPISAGVIFQCEPKAYADEKLRAAQRAVPIAIVHGKQDVAVPFAQGEYAAKLFEEAKWPAVKFFADDSGAGHRFALLPLDEAIHWLEKHASADSK